MASAPGEALNGRIEPPALELVGVMLHRAEEQSIDRLATALVHAWHREKTS